MQSVDAQNGKNFWKKNSKSVPGSIRAVYGAMHPPITQSPRLSPRKESIISKKVDGCDTFQDFQESVDDAWDCGDDEFCVISDVKISNRIVQSAAISVINNHRTEQLTAGSNDIQGSTEESDLPITHTSGTVIATAVATNDSQNGQNTSDKRFSQQRSAELARKVSSEIPSNEREAQRFEKFYDCLNNNTSLAELRELSWSGIPSQSRAITWRILNGYLPANNERREETMQRKREEYWNFVRQYYDTRHEDIHQDTYRQIHIDIPRMSPLVPLFQQIIVQELFERILYIWAIRHPASGYVQGINDLVTPFFMVFLREVVPLEYDVDTYDISKLSEEDRNVVEADCFWCTSKLLDGIQDSYTFAQPGIQTKVQQLRDLLIRIDAVLHEHLEKHEIDYLQFSFRWFNNLLMRELPLRCTVRLWDTLHAEPDGFSHFVLYVSAAFLKYFSQKLMAQKDFQGLMLLLQNLPTNNWTDSEISMVVAEAFRLKYVFADAPKHLQGNKK